VAERTKKPTKAPFVWPPRPRAVPPAVAPVSLPTHRRAAGAPPARASVLPAIAERWLRALEETWLGIVGEPLGRRAARAAWRPLEPRGYCTRCGRLHDPDRVTPSPTSQPNRAEPCGGCAPERPPWDRVAILNAYREDLAAWIREVKFHQNRALGQSLGRLLGRSLRAMLEDSGLNDRRVIIVPVPMTTRRRLWRGIDHARVIADAAARELDGRVWPGVARAHRPSQVSVSLAARATNLAGAFSPRRSLAARLRSLVPRVFRAETEAPPRGTKPTVYIVVDDVMTTGATMRGVCRALRQGLKARGEPRATVWAAVLGVSPALGPTNGGVLGGVWLNPAGRAGVEGRITRYSRGGPVESPPARTESENLNEPTAPGDPRMQEFEREQARDREEISGGRGGPISV
jgi:predicted amidophosphoribosyltransferase